MSRNPLFFPTAFTPPSIDSRCGRTARAGRSGLAASLATLDDLPYTVELMTPGAEDLGFPVL